MVQALVNVISSLSIFVAIVLGFLIVYANNFIIKRRKKRNWNLFDARDVKC